MLNEKESKLATYFLKRPAFGLCYMLQDDKECHWITNVSKEDGVNCFLSTGLKMQNSL